MSWISGYSPDFQDAYNRRLKTKVEGKKVFDEWVKEFEKWINPTSKEPTITKEAEPSKPQLKALAYEAKLEGVENVGIKEYVKDSRTLTGERLIYRDVITGRFAKNPYKEIKTE